MLLLCTVSSWKSFVSLIFCIASFLTFLHSNFFLVYFCNFLQSHYSRIKHGRIFYNRNRFLCCYFILCLVERVSSCWFFAWLASNVIWNVRKQDLCQNKKNFYEEHAWKNADFFSSLPFASTAFIDLRKCHSVDENSSEVVLVFLKFRFSEKTT